MWDLDKGVTFVEGKISGANLYENINIDTRM